MRAFFALLLCLIAGTASPQAIPWPGPGTPHTVAPPFTGAGDVVSGANYYWALRGYTAAIAAAGTQRLANVRRASDNGACDVLVATNGGLGNTANCTGGPSNGTSVATLCNATTCFITTLYDQAGSARDISQATAANQPGLTLNALGALPMISFVGANGSNMVTASFTTPADPWTYSFVINYTNSGQQSLGFGNTDSRQIGFNTAAPDQIFYYEGASVPTATMSAAAYHAVQAIFNNAGANSLVSIDGTNTSMNTGNTLAAQAQTFTLGRGSGQVLTAFIGEYGNWPFAFNSTQQTNMNSNQHLYWGFL